MEQRVKTLEQEMKILKNQIQKTLLDVQEQVLLRYHPALRPDEGLSNGTAAAENNRLAETNHQDQPAARFTSPLVRQVSLAEGRTTPAAPPTTSTHVTLPTTGQDSFAALSAWVATSVGQIGGEKTRKILALRAAATGIPPHVHDTLNELIGLYSDDEEMRQGAAAEMLQQLNQLLDPEPGHHTVG